MRRPAPVLLAGAVFLVATLWLLSSSLLGGKILSSNDFLLFNPPFEAQRPAALESPSNPHLGDAAYLFHPNLYQARAEIRSGRLPAWNPAIGAGRPVASQQGAPFYPVHWLAYLLPFWESLAVIAALKLLTAAFGMFLLCRSLCLGVWPAILAGVTFTFGAGIVLYIEHPQGIVFSLLPWLFLLADRICGRARVVDTLLFGGALGATVLAGHPESVLVTCFAVFPYAGYRLAAMSRAGDLPRPALYRRATLFAGAAGLSLCVGAIMILPFLEALTQSVASTLPGPQLPRSALLTFAFPELWGRPDKLEFGGPDILAGRPIYMGVFPLLIGFAGLWIRRTGTQLFFAGLWMASLALVVQLPVVSEVVAEVPPLSLIARRHFVFLTAFSGAVLAGYGLHNVLQASWSERKRLLAILAGAAVVPLLWLLGHLGLLSLWREVPAELPVLSETPDSAGTAMVASVARWALLAVAVVGAAAVLLGRARRGGAALALIAVGLTVFDLVTMHRGYHPAVDKVLAAPPAPESVRVLQASPHARFAGTGVALIPNTGQYYGIRDLRTVDLPALERHIRLYRALGGASNERLSITSFEPERPRALDLLDFFAVKYVLLDAPGRLPRSGYPPVVDRAGEQLVLNEGALPRAWLTYDWRPASDFEGALDATIASTIDDLRARPLIEGAGPAPPPGESRGASGRVTILSDRADEVSIEFTARQPGYLILSDTYYPGWRAELDGRPVPVRAANAAFRGVSVPPGRHTVAFRYESSAVWIGRALTGLALVAIVGGLIAGRLRARRSRPRRRAIG